MGCWKKSFCLKKVKKLLIWFFICRPCERKIHSIILFSDHDIDIVSRIFYIFFFSSEHQKVSSTCNQSLILYFQNLSKVKIEFQYLYIFREFFFHALTHINYGCIMVPVWKFECYFMKKKNFYCLRSRSGKKEGEISIN